MEIENIIQKIKTIIKPVIKNRETLSINFPVEFTFLHVLERVDCSLESLGLLVKSDILTHEHAIGLISRNLLSDFITTGFILKESKSEEDFYCNLYLLHVADLNKGDDLINMYKEAKIITNEESQKYYEKISEPQSIYFTIRNYAKENSLKSFPTTKSIIKKFLKSNSIDGWTQEIINSYDTWLFYSKYEHLGWYSHEFTRKVSKEKATERLKNVLRLTAILIGSCLEKLKEDQPLQESIKIIKILQGKKLECR